MVKWYGKGLMTEWLWDQTATEETIFYLLFTWIKAWKQKLILGTILCAVILQKEGGVCR